MKSEKLVKSEILEKLEKSDIQKWKGRKVTQFGGFFSGTSRGEVRAFRFGHRLN